MKWVRIHSLAGPAAGTLENEDMDTMSIRVRVPITILDTLERR
jgi:hypothetical protein